MTIAFDFDGVVHLYSEGRKDGSIYDSISYQWVVLVRKLLTEGHGVFILSTRPKRQIYKHMKKLYCIRNSGCSGEWSTLFAFRIMPFWEKFFKKKEIDGLPSVGICNHKAIFDVLIDDRAIQFDGNYKGLFEKIINFKPWIGNHDKKA